MENKQEGSEIGGTRVFPLSLNFDSVSAYLCVLESQVLVNRIWCKEAYLLRTSSIRIPFIGTKFYLASDETNSCWSDPVIGTWTRIVLVYERETIGIWIPCHYNLVVAWRVRINRVLQYLIEVVPSINYMHQKIDQARSITQPVAIYDGLYTEDRQGKIRLHRSFHPVATFSLYRLALHASRKTSHRLATDLIIYFPIPFEKGKLVGNTGISVKQRTRKCTHERSRGA